MSTSFGSERLRLITVLALGIMIGAFLHNYMNKKNVSRINVSIKGNVGDKSLRRRIDSALTNVVEFHELLQKEVQEILKDNNDNIHLKNEDRIF